MNNYYEPTEIIPGETVEWRKAFADYNPADGWALTYYFRGAAVAFDATGTADGGSWKVTLVVATDAAAGRVDWQAWATKGGEERLADSGVATIGVSIKTISSVDSSLNSI